MENNNINAKQVIIYLASILLTLALLIGGYYLASLKNTKTQMQQQLSQNDHQLNMLKKQLSQLQQANANMSQRIIALENNLKVRMHPLSVGH